MKYNFNILILEDDLLSLEIISMILKDYGTLYKCRTASDIKKIPIDLSKIDIAFIDLEINGKLDGFTVAKKLKSLGIYTVIVSGHNGKDFIKKGHEYSNVDEYVTKPYEKDLLLDIIINYSNRQKTQATYRKIKSRLQTHSPAMETVIETIQHSYLSSSPVYLFGNTGTGKQIIAETIHEMRFNSLENFYHLNCSAIPDTMIESELFGHEKGAFTGANNTKIGLLEKANGGTLFLDEVATMSPSMQNKLIIAVEKKFFRRLGSNENINSSFRLIAATSSDLAEEVNKGNFRSDLFFRLNGTHIHVPSLSDRLDDLDLLIEYFVSQSGKGRTLYFSSEATTCLKKYAWPGNIRELRNLVNEFIDKKKSRIELSDLPAHIIKNEDIFNKNKLKFLNKKLIAQIRELGLSTFLEEIREEAINYYLKENTGQIRKTASILQMPPATLHRHYTKLNNQQPELFH